MPYVYNPATGKNDLWQPEEVTTASGMSGRTTRTLNEPRTIDKVLGSLSRFGEDFLKGVTAPPSANRTAGLYGPGTKTTTSTGTGMTGPAQTGVQGPTGMQTGMYSATPEQQKNYLASLQGTTPSVDAGQMLDTSVDATEPGYKPLFTAQELMDKENTLYSQLRQFQELTARNASESQRRALSDAIRKTQRDYNEARGAIMETGMVQDRQLLQAAEQRGLGGSGLEQLGRTQQRMATGENINQLSQQYGDQLQGYLNAELGIEQNLAEALSKSALDETINVTTAMAKAMDNVWSEWQRNETVKGIADDKLKENATLFLEYVTALTNAGEDAALKEQIRTSYRGLVPEDLFVKGENLAGNKALGDVARKASVRTSAASSGTEDQARFAAAMAQDEGDGRVSMLKTGSTTLYFPNDDGLVLYVRGLYSGRENANRIQIAVKGGKVVYTTDQGQEFTTYNQASNSLG
jgi:hypothetical protein